MGLINKAKEFMSGHKDKGQAGVDKVGDVIDEKTDGKYADKIDKAQEAVKNSLGKAGGQQ